MSASRKALLAFIGASATFLAAGPASAQSSEVLSSNWRQQNRSDAVAAANSSPQYFAFELRLGPYWPKVDSEFQGKTPYKDVFGTGPQLYFGLEADFLPLRIPYVGVIGPGLGWGYTSTSAKAKFASGGKDGTESDQDTSLSIMPMYVAAVLRVDELMRRTWVPLVPYAKFGFGFALWKTTDGAGKSVVVNDGVRYAGDGNVLGLHLALGGMLSLNFLDRRAATRLDEATGVNHIYLFGEWMNSILDNLGTRPALRAGTSTIIGGLALDI